MPSPPPPSQWLRAIELTLLVGVGPLPSTSDSLMAFCSWSQLFDTSNGAPPTAPLPSPPLILSGDLVSFLTQKRQTNLDDTFFDPTIFIFNYSVYADTTLTSSSPQQAFMKHAKVGQQLADAPLEVPHRRILCPPSSSMPAKDQTPLQQHAGEAWTVVSPRHSPHLPPRPPLILQQARPAYQVPQTEMEGEPTQDHTNKALQGAGRPSPSATTILQKGLNTSNAPPKNTSASPIKTAAAAQMTTTDLPAPGSTSVTPATQSKVLPPTNNSAQLDTNPSTKPPPQLFMPKCLSAVLTPMHKASISQTPSTSTTLGCTIGIPNIATASLEQMKVLKDIWERNREPMAKTVEDLQANNLDQKIPQAYDMAVHNFRCISRFCIQFNFGTSQQEASQPCLWEARNGGSGAHKEHPHNW
ncbi:hypothetical protein PtA15_5A723 [Puccinia triticina]|uniref:Uncharacterized protein n=1 Tax=Puccinia triticina TaxID=208348 RepID=A0ABY7CKG5_9BASI|nr:uncharacterized protein PtA15_5A723 [Puccinia triticina]WAQ85149.1 hypothetical protein PtA15_5A723 [Puccinia triticina]